MLRRCHLSLWTLDLFFYLVLEVGKLILLLVVRYCALAGRVLLCCSNFNMSFARWVHCFVVNFFWSFFRVFLLLIELKPGRMLWSSLPSNLQEDLFEKLWKWRVILLVLDHNCISFACQLLNLITDLSIWIFKQHGLECAQRLWLFSEQCLSLRQITSAINANKTDHSRVFFVSLKHDSVYVLPAVTVFNRLNLSSYQNLLVVTDRLQSGFERGLIA